VVLAAPTSREAQVSLELDAPGADPVAAAQQFQQRRGVPLQGGASAWIAGLRAYHASAEVRQGAASLVYDFTWIALNGQVYRLTGATAAAHYPVYASTFRAVARSFHRLGRGEREGIRQGRLRLVRARGGEGLAALSRRTGNLWSSEQTAAANGLASTRVRLRAGQRLKIVRSEPL